MGISRLLLPDASEQITRVLACDPMVLEANPKDESKPEVPGAIERYLEDGDEDVINIPDDAIRFTFSPLTKSQSARARRAAKDGGVVEGCIETVSLGLKNIDDPLDPSLGVVGPVLADGPKAYPKSVIERLPHDVIFEISARISKASEIPGFFGPSSVPLSGGRSSAG